MDILKTIRKNKMDTWSSFLTWLSRKNGKTVVSKMQDGNRLTKTRLSFR